MQPVQDLTIDATVSRTQYQFALQDANPDEFTTWVPKPMARLNQIPDITDVATNFGETGLSAYINIDRATAGRFEALPRRPSTTRSTMRRSASVSSRQFLHSRTSTALSSKRRRKPSRR